MARYDETDYRPPLAGGAVPPAGTGASGSRLTQYDDPTIANIDVGDLYDHDRFPVSVGADDTMAGPQAYNAYQREPISGQTGIGETGAGQGNVRGPRHPNAANQAGEPR